MLRVSDNRRFLVREDGTPFFYLADTVWELFHRANRHEAELLLRDRAAKNFTVIQAVVLAETDGLHTPNALGELPLIGDDPTKPNEAYFAHVDYIVHLAGSLGLTIGMLPTWGDKWNKEWGVGPEIFTPENARIYGEWLAKRYKDSNLIWILGGDRPIKTETHRAIIENMAAGLRAGDGGKHLITFHPVGSHGSSEYFAKADWIDFQMWQSGHSRNRDNYNSIAADYALSPVNPTLDAEPGYEDHMAGFNTNNGYLDDWDVRKAAYWSVFAGACGHTYGCHPIWQLWLPGRQGYTWVRRPWYQALHLPGSSHVQHLRALVESRPYFSRIPDTSLVMGEVAEGGEHIQATRDVNGSYAFVYFPTNKKAEIDLKKLTGTTLQVWWYDPRTGLATDAGTLPRTASHTFTPPDGGPDQVLVLDDAAFHYPKPGH